MPPSNAPAVEPTPVEVNLLTSAQGLPAEVASFDVWRSGLTARPVTSIAGGTWPGTGCPADEEPKAEAESSAVETFDPFITYTVQGCLDGAPSGRLAEFRAEAEAALVYQTPYRMARELWTGERTGNPSLQSTATDVSATSAMPASEAADLLLARFEDCTAGARGWLHVPTVLAGQMASKGYLRRVGRQLQTIQGHVVIPGPGYPGAGEWGPEDAVDPTAADGEAWIYVTGPVEAAVGTVFHTGTPDRAVGSFGRTQEQLVFAEQYAIVRFPATCTFAALATVED